MTGRSAALPLILMCSILLLTNEARGQVVVGTVTDGATAEPISGAWVVLETLEGERVAGALTGRDGRYVIRAPSEGRYRLLAEMIGYAPTRSGAIDLGPDATYRQDLTVEFEPIQLAGITAEVSDRCRRRPGRGPVTGRLWEEARKALEIARWTEAESSIRFQFHRVRRELDPQNYRVLAQEILRARTGYYGGSPYASLPADSLDRHGWVQREADGELAYYGPDATVLLSDAFLDGHCFHVMGPPGADEPQLVGLAFEPLPGRTLPDIRGVLWLDGVTGALDRVDFTYTNLPFGRNVEWPQVGGRVEFQQLTNGAWIVRRWRLRMPVVKEVRRGEYRSSSRSLELAALHELSGEVTQGVTLSGEPVLAREASGLYGTVTDPDGRPLSGAEVRVAGTPFRDTTDASGGFRISPLPPGRYGIQVEYRNVTTEIIPGSVTPLGGGITALVTETVGPGYADQERTVELKPGEEVRLSLALTAAAGAGDGRAAPRDDRPGGRTPDESGEPAPGGRGLVGRVVDPSTGRAVAGALVSVFDSAGTVLSTDVTRAEGHFALRDLQPGTVYLEIEALGYTGSVEYPVHYDGEPLFLELEVRPAPIGVEDVIVSVSPQKIHLRERGYYDRMRTGHGRFVTPESIASRHASRSSDLLRAVAGVTLLSGVEPVLERALRQRFSGEACFPALYLDGVAVRTDPSVAGGDAFNAIMPPPEQIDALEVYPGGATVPPQWGGSASACGVIVVWTKR